MTSAVLRLSRGELCPASGGGAGWGRPAIACDMPTQRPRQCGRAARTAAGAPWPQRPLPPELGGDQRSDLLRDAPLSGRPRKCACSVLLEPSRRTWRCGGSGCTQPRPASLAAAVHPRSGTAGRSPPSSVSRACSQPRLHCALHPSWGAERRPSTRDHSPSRRLQAGVRLSRIPFPHEGSPSLAFPHVHLGRPGRSPASGEARLESAFGTPWPSALARNSRWRNGSSWLAPIGQLPRLGRH